MNANLIIFVFQQKLMNFCDLFDCKMLNGNLFPDEWKFSIFRHWFWFVITFQTISNIFFPRLHNTTNDFTLACYYISLWFTIFKNTDCKHIKLRLKIWNIWKFIDLEISLVITDKSFCAKLLFHVLWILIKTFFLV